VTQPPGASPSDSLRDVYERRAELQYAEPVEPPDPAVDRKFERIAEAVRAHLPCASLLDAGCGDGRYFHVIATDPPTERLAGCDISERILATARETAAQVGLSPELVRANVEALPFEDAAFDLVLCTQVLEHLLSPADGVRELARALRPGGVLLLSADHVRNTVTRVLFAPRLAVVGLLGLRNRHAPVLFPEHRFETEELAQILAEAGLAVDHLETFRFSVPPPLGRRTRRLVNRIEKALPRHRHGDIVLAFARKP
jgi:2-polyprenyl-3-methyl-5-hydroxy-6-metoxy-1,4-benzoquinol methylase